MTTTYALNEVPPTGTDRSRFALTTSATGIEVAAGLNIANAFHGLLAERISEAGHLAPEEKEIVLKRIFRTPEGNYALLDCRPIRARLTIPPTPTSGKFSKRHARGGALLDEFFLGGEPWHTTRDDSIWSAALELAQQQQLQGHPLRMINEAVMLGVLARHGIVVNAWDLPL